MPRSRRREQPISARAAAGYAHDVRVLTWAPKRGLLTRATLLLRRWGGRSQAGLTVAMLGCAVLIVAGVRLFPEQVGAAVVVPAAAARRGVPAPATPPGGPGRVRARGDVVAVVDRRADRDPGRRDRDHRVGPGQHRVRPRAAASRAAGCPGDLMLVDLRDRLAAHGRVPRLPDGWQVDSVIRSAHADGFSGDFMVAGSRDGESTSSWSWWTCPARGSARVCGRCSSRARSGACSARCRVRSSSARRTGTCSTRTGRRASRRRSTWPSTCPAGLLGLLGLVHPPAIQRHAGSGRLDVVDTIGSPALGVVADFVCQARAGRLDRGDVLMLYTDGADQGGAAGDLDQGIDRLMGAADRVLSPGGGRAAQVLAGVAARDDDDRAVVLIRRD